MVMITNNGVINTDNERMCRLVVATRKWLDSRGGGGPFPGARPLPAMTNEQMTDRYSQHTRDCPSCSAVRHLTTLFELLSTLRMCMLQPVANRGL